MRQQQAPSASSRSAQFVVGIDLGTTNSAVAYVDAGDPQRRVHSFPIPQLVAEANIADRPTLPSFLYVGGEHDVAPGSLALPWDPDRAYAVGAMHPDPKQIIMIGLSSGSWAQVIANNPAVDRLTVVEINPGYFSLIANEPEVASLLRNPKVTIVTDDGRRWLRAHPERHFDAVISNTTWHFRANVANLLSVEFLDLVRHHLNPDGHSQSPGGESSPLWSASCGSVPWRRGSPTISSWPDFSGLIREGPGQVS